MMSSAKVLLVDDEKEFTDALSERLQLRDMEVFTASSGPEALDLAEQHRFDTVIVDLQMPGMDGIDTLKNLLAADADQQVIVLTGHGTISKSVEALKAGAKDFFEKPVDIQTLSDIIGKAAAQRLTLLQERSAQAIEDVLKKKGW
jgi:DNA-binding NtrC family response regulator